METKICSTCKKEKPLSEFGKNRRMKDGHHYTCKQCVSDYQRKRYVKKGSKIRRDQRARNADYRAELEWYREHYPQEGKPWAK